MVHICKYQTWADSGHQYCGLVFYTPNFFPTSHIIGQVACTEISLVILDYFECPSVPIFELPDHALEVGHFLCLQGW